MATEVSELDFKDRVNLRINIELNGKKYALKRYTIAQEIEIKRAFDGNMVTWHQGLKEMDGETLIKTLWIFLEDKETYKTWEDLAVEISGDLNEKINIVEAISACVTSSMPEVADAVKKRIQEDKKMVIQSIRASLTGPSSTIGSPKPTAGRRSKSKTSPITK